MNRRGFPPMLDVHTRSAKGRLETPALESLFFCCLFCYVRFLYIVHTGGEIFDFCHNIRIHGQYKWLVIPLK